MENGLNLKWRSSIKRAFRVLPMVLQHWMFTEDTEAKAMLAHQMAIVTEKNDMNINDLQQERDINAHTGYDEEGHSLNYQGNILPLKEH